jgi:hypothetical protein
MRLLPRTAFGDSTSFIDDSILDDGGFVPLLWIDVVCELMQRTVLLFLELEAYT